MRSVELSELRKNVGGTRCQKCLATNDCGRHEITTVDSTSKFKGALIKSSGNKSKWRVGIKLFDWKDSEK